MDWCREKYFTAINKIVGRDVILAYPSFSKQFIIHIYARKTHIRGVIIQNGKPIYFYLHKSTPEQNNDKNTHIKLLSIVETLK